MMLYDGSKFLKLFYAWVTGKLHKFTYASLWDQFIVSDKIEYNSYRFVKADNNTVMACRNNVCNSWIICSTCHNHLILKECRQEKNDLVNKLADIKNSYIIVHS